MVVKDYSKFRNIAGNRPLSQPHVAKLVKAIERKNLLEYYPVLVNEKWEVIDGQHRLAAAAQLDYEVHVEEVPGLKIDDVMEINTNSKSWTLRDFVDSYIQLGSADYKALSEFSAKNRLSLIVSARLLGGMAKTKGPGNVRNMQGGGIHSGNIRRGQFRALTPDIAERVANWLHELNTYAEFDTHVDRNFIGAILALAYNENFDFNRLITKVKASGRMILRKGNPKYYLLELEDIYNYGAKSAVELYASSQLSQSTISR